MDLDVSPGVAEGVILLLGGGELSSLVGATPVGQGVVGEVYEGWSLLPVGRRGLLGGSHRVRSPRGKGHRGRGVGVPCRLSGGPVGESTESDREGAGWEAI